jgi:hypothetical protein
MFPYQYYTFSKICQNFTEEKALLSMESGVGQRYLYQKRAHHDDTPFDLIF